MQHPLVYKSLESIRPYDRNPKHHPEDQLEKIVKSVKQFGFTSPLIITETEELLAGHGRLLAAKRLELSSVPCIVVSGLTDSEKKAYIIADNKIADMAEYDHSLIFELVQEIELSHSELVDVLGLGDDELTAILSSVGDYAQIAAIDEEELRTKALQAVESIASSAQGISEVVSLRILSKDKAAIKQALSELGLELLEWC